MLTAKEMLSTLGYPCRPVTANQLQTDPCIAPRFVSKQGKFQCCPRFCPALAKDVRRLESSQASNAALAKMAGNGMCLLPAGFAALVTLVRLSDK